MRKLRSVIFILAATAAVGLPVRSIWKSRQIIENGTEVIRRVQGYDPYDSFRGRYIALSVGGNSYRYYLNEKLAGRVEPIQRQLFRYGNVSAKFRVLDGDMANAVLTQLLVDGVPLEAVVSDDARYGELVKKLDSAVKNRATTEKTTDE